MIKLLEHGAWETNVRVVALVVLTVITTVTATITVLVVQRVIAWL
tara:strand:- start:370 stop:504 length:135 start_codon:yes stop_codon:yes gene_type:complete